MGGLQKYAGHAVAQSRVGFLDDGHHRLDIYTQLGTRVSSGRFLSFGCRLTSLLLTRSPTAGRGAIYVDSDSLATITDSAFENNTLCFVNDETTATIMGTAATVSARAVRTTGDEDTATSRSMIRASATRFSCQLYDDDCCGYDYETWCARTVTLVAAEARITRLLARARRIRCLPSVGYRCDTVGRHLL